MDFTIKQYIKLLKSLQTAGFFFQTFSEYLLDPNEKVVILRHDVDLLPQNSLQFAKIQAEHEVKGSYYFRVVSESWDVGIISDIAGMGHEVGYHYEDVDLAAKIVNSRKYVVSKKNEKGREREKWRKGEGESNKRKDESTKSEQKKELAAIAIELFEKHLYQFRKYYPIQTICMHGNPLSKFDNKLLWKYYDYKDFGIIGEPYFDVDFDNVFYLTDTGRRWDGYKVSLRDKSPQQETWAGKGFTFHHTSDLIQAAVQDKLPNQIMMTIHPQRWSDKFGPWVKELVWQNVKNMGKWWIVKIR